MGFNCGNILLQAQKKLFVELIFLLIPLILFSITMKPLPDPEFGNDAKE